MSVESDFYTLLAGAAGVTALVSTRIYPDAMPEGSAYPAVIFARTSTDPLVGIHGASFGSDVELSIGCWAKTRTSADAVADAVAAALNGSAFFSTAREAAYDPESGLFATIILAETFAAS